MAQLAALCGEDGIVWFRERVVIDGRPARASVRVGFDWYARMLAHTVDVRDPDAAGEPRDDDE